MKTIRIPLLAIAFALSGCSGSKDEHMEDIIRYQTDTIRKAGMTTAEYLPLVKPYSIWDTRPQHVAEVTWRGTAVQSRYMPDILWGYIGTRVLHLMPQDIFPHPQQFIRSSQSSAAAYIAEAKANMDGIRQLISLVGQSENVLFVWQDWLKTNAFNRVNDVFFQNGKYWRYVIPPGSPYPMSSQTEHLSDYAFSALDQRIFAACKEAGFYCVLKQKNCIVLMKGGMTANTCGFIWSLRKPTDESLGHLFHLCQVSPVTDGLYYYVSN